MNSIETPQSKIKKKLSRKKIILLLLIVLALIILGTFFYKTGFTFSRIINIKNISWKSFFGKSSTAEYIPTKDKNRINILLLGIRGAKDKNGGLLTDSIIIASFKKDTKKIALISLPRDIYLDMPGTKYREKINAAYVIGQEKYKNGLDYTRKVVGYVSGLYIDHVVVIDFRAFEDIIDLLGGITVHLNKPFVEDKQWWCDKYGKNCRPFIVGAGNQKLTGKRALLYVRSRFSSSDFDRERRQQQVIIAIKNKLLSMKVLTNPILMNHLLNVIANNIKTDIMPWKIPELINLAKNADTTHIIKKTFDVSENSPFYQTKENGIYILLPKNGNFDKVREDCQRVFE